MGLYILKTFDLKNRHPALLAYDESNRVSFPDADYFLDNRQLEKNEKKNSTSEPFYLCVKGLKEINTYIDIIDLTIGKGLESLEFYINKQSENILDKIPLIEEYLEDKELSVGLLVDFELDKQLSFYNPKKRIRRSIRKPKAARVISFEPKLMASRCSFCFVPTHPLEESFHDRLLRLVNNSNKTNVEIYTKGGITRQVFSKIISDKNYLPKKGTIISLIIGLELDLDDALTLLNSAGYTLSSSILFDSLIKDFLGEGNYDLDEINMTLNEHGLPLLGWKPR